MAYFPFFVDLSNKKGLVVGGGNVALRKVQKIIEFEPELTVIAPEVEKEFGNFQTVEIIKRQYREGDEDNFYFVIAATNNRDVNKLISTRCREKNILVNVVDDPELCSFLFPCLVKEGKLTVGISTSGSSPTAAIEIKKRIREMIPEDFDGILDYLHSEREKLKDNVSSVEERSEILRKLFLEKMKL